MSNRLNQEREEKLRPIRFTKAVKEIEKLGFKATDDVCMDRVRFEYEGSTILYYPYSGWATGKTIKDGRGLAPLLRQLRGNP
jgi:hypothetical protein